MGIGGSSLEIPGGGTEGYHVLKVQDNSPGSRAGLEAFFDYIVAVNGSRLDQDNDTLKLILNSNIDKQVKLLVYSRKTMNVREVPLTPSKNWGGQGVSTQAFSVCLFVCFLLITCFFHLKGSWRVNKILLVREVKRERVAHSRRGAQFAGRFGRSPLEQRLHNRCRFIADRGNFVRLQSTILKKDKKITFYYVISFFKARRSVHADRVV